MSDQIKVCFNGCSHTVGEGFDPKDRQTFVYDSLVSRHFNWDKDNIALPGSSNYLIFMRSVTAIKSKKYKILFNQWTTFNRFWISPGPLVWIFNLDKKYPDFRYRDIYLSQKDLKKFKEWIMILNHDFQNILDLIDYCKILNDLGELHEVKIIHINGALPWEQDIEIDLMKESINLEETLSAYTKQILDFDHRDDQEICNLWKIVRDKFVTMEKNNWINIFETWNRLNIDVGPLGHHPGIKSNRYLANKIIEFFETRNK